MILFDNLEGVFGNDALDRALTSTRWKDRILGKSEEVELPLIPAWYATCNNVQVAADTLRRVIHIRLDCLSERPEERSGFKHENLLAWIDANRGRLLTAALTILSVYLKRGRASKHLKPFGSFEGWSSVVREAVAWVGLPDPCLTRTKLAESSDAAPPNADDGARWRCTACGWSGSARRIYDDQTDLLINLVEAPDCPPVVLRLLERCGWLLHWISQGDAMAVGQSGDAARHAVRILDHFADREPWFDDAE